MEVVRCQDIMTAALPLTSEHLLDSFPVIVTGCVSLIKSMNLSKPTSSIFCTWLDNDISKFFPVSGILVSYEIVTANIT